MGKRFTDTDKWKKPFIKGLEAPYKLLWFYMVDDCDVSGIWQTDFEVASLRIGFEVTAEKAKEVFKDKIIELDKGEKWFIPSFIDFQYVQLKDNNKAHIKAISNLNKYKLLDKDLKVKGHSRGFQDPKEEDKEKDKVKEEEKVKEEAFAKFWDLYEKKEDKKKCETKFLSLSLDDINKILQVVPDYVKSKPDVQFRKNPLTYLNGECWNDEITGNNMYCPLGNKIDRVKYPDWDSSYPFTPDNQYYYNNNKPLKK